MKLIALKDFAKVGALQDLEIDGLIHEDHIHKGALLTVGAAEKFNDLRAAEKELVAQLAVSGCVGDATNEKIVKAVRDEIAIDKKREENAKKLNAAADNSELIKQLTALIAKVATSPAK